MPTKERRDTDVNDNEDSSRWIPLEALSKQSAGIGTGGLKVLKVFWPGVDEKRKVTDFIEDATRFEFLILPCHQRSPTRALHPQSLRAIEDATPDHQATVFWSKGNQGFDGFAPSTTLMFSGSKKNRMCVALKSGAYECTTSNLLKLDHAIRMLMSSSEGMTVHERNAAQVDPNTVYIFPRPSPSRRSFRNAEKNHQQLSVDDLPTFGLSCSNYVLDFGRQPLTSKDQQAWMQCLVAQVLSGLSNAPSTEGVADRHNERIPPKLVIRGTETMLGRPLEVLMDAIARTLKLSPDCIKVAVEFEILIATYVDMPATPDVMAILRLIRFDFARALDKLSLWNEKSHPPHAPYLMLIVVRPRDQESITALLDIRDTPSAPPDTVLQSRLLRTAPARKRLAIATESYKSAL